MYMTPTLKWEKQFAIMIEKMKEAMCKLKWVPISIVNTHMYYNMYLLRRVYFGYGIMRLMPNQEKELMKLSENVLIKKMGLSKKFPRKLLYARWNSIGVGIIQPNTAIAMNKIRLYLGNTRLNSNAGQMILPLEEIVNAQNGYSEEILKMYPAKYF